MKYTLKSLKKPLEQWAQSVSNERVTYVLWSWDFDKDGVWVELLGYPYYGGFQLRTQVLSYKEVKRFTNGRA